MFQKVRKIIVNIFIVIIVSVVSLLIVEMLLRTFYVRDGLKNHFEFHLHSCVHKVRPQNISDTFMFSNHSYRPKFETNSVGYRDVEHAKEKPDDVYRIVIIGDSMVEGREVEFEERFDQLLDKELKHENKKIEIITFSASSYHPLNYLHIMECLGSEYDPDLYIVNYFPQNDFKGIGKNKSGSVFRLHNGVYEHRRDVKNKVGGLIYDDTSVFLRMNMKLFGEKKSYIFLLLHDVFYKRLNQSVVSTQRGDGQYLEAYYGKNRGAATNFLWLNAESLFKKMKEVSEAQETELLFVNLSSRQLVVRKKVVKLYGNEFSEEEILYPEKREQAFFEKINVHYLNLQQALHSIYRDSQEELYADGVHFNSLGQRYVADIIKTYIESNEIIK